MRVDTTLHVMGCEAEVIVVADEPDALAAHARTRLLELERLWSRFIDDSEISRCNRAAGSWCLVSSETMLLVRRGLDGYALTDGRFDPTVLGAVLRAGYTTSFERLMTDGRRVEPGASELRTGARAIAVDETVGAVRMPPGVGFDPGGIGKGLAADLVTGELLQLGAAGACVNLGGDLRVRGVAPDGGPWLIAVDDPSGGPPLCTVCLTDGAVATSARTRRRWTADDGSERHHLIDARADSCASVAATAATVIAAEGWQAEVLAKHVLLAGMGEELDAFERIETLGAAALVVDGLGVETTSGWSHFTIEAREGIR